jgi:RNA polymerase sigma-70 factor, ECF subfamily
MPDWQVILSRYGPTAWRIAYQLLGNQDDADECFQEACLAALNVCRRQPVNNWQGLLIHLVTSRSVDRLRLNKRARIQASSSGLEQLKDAALAPIQQAEESELADELRTALGKIPPRQAEVFCLHCIEDWSYQEIAGHLGISIDSVGVLLHRARNRLRKLLAKFQKSISEQARRTRRR